MKRIILVFILAFLLFVQSPLYIQYDVSEIEGFLNENCSYIDIKSTGNIKSVKEFSNAISEFCEKENAFVATLSYRVQPDQDEITELFVAGRNIPDFLENKGLTDIVLTDNLNEHTKIHLPLFHPSKTCVVQNFEQLEDKSIEDLMDKKIFQLSGGEQQRVALARLFIKEPTILLADEPTASLDPENSEMVLNAIEELHKKGTTIILVTHNPDIVKRASRTVQIQ